LDIPHHKILKSLQKKCRADLTFLPGSLRETANPSKKSWLPRPLQASTRRSESFGWTRLMAAPQAQWLWPRRQEKSKEDRPPVASRPQKSRTTSGAKTPRTPPSLTAGCASRSSRAGPQAPARRRETRRIRPSTALTGSRHSPPSRGGTASMMRATPRPKSSSRMTRTTTTRAAGGPAVRQGPPKGAAAPTTRPTGPMTGTNRPRRPPRAGAASQRTPPLAGVASPCTPLVGAASLRGPPARTCKAASHPSSFASTARGLTQPPIGRTAPGQRLLTTTNRQRQQRRWQQ
jgi:hypothetical protein